MRDVPFWPPKGNITLLSKTSKKYITYKLKVFFNYVTPTFNYVTPVFNYVTPLFNYVINLYKRATAILMNHHFTKLRFI